MQVVIDISEEKYKWLKEHIPKADKNSIVGAVVHGVPLPKGHKIIDASSLQEHLALVPMKDRTYREAVEIIDRFPSIIEADKEYEDEIITRGNCMMCGKELDEGLFFCKECEAKAESEEE